MERIPLSKKIAYIWHEYKKIVIGIILIDFLISVWLTGLSANNLNAISNQPVKHNLFWSGFENYKGWVVILLVLLIFEFFIYNKYFFYGGNRTAGYRNSRAPFGDGGDMSPMEAEKVFKVTDIRMANSFIMGWKNRKRQLVYQYQQFRSKTDMTLATALCGSPGTGKSAYIKLLMMMIARMHEKGAQIIAMDASGDLAKEFFQFFAKRLGYKTYVINTITPAHSDGFNLLDILKLPIYDSVYTAAGVLANIMIMNYEPKNPKDFFPQETEDILRWMIMYCQSNLAEIYALASNKKRLIKILKHCQAENPAAMSVDQFLSYDDRKQGRVLEGLCLMLRSIQDPAVANMTGHSDLDLNILGEEKAVIFITASATEEYTSFYASSLCAMINHILMTKAAMKKDNRLPLPTYIIIDEFQSLVTIPKFTGVLNNIRKTGATPIIAYQDNNGLKIKYGSDEYLSVLQAFDIQMLFGTNDTITAIYNAEKSGETTANLSRDPFNDDLRPVRTAVTADQILRMPVGNVRIKIRQERAIELEAVYYKEFPDYAMVKAAGPYDLSERIPLWKERGEEEVTAQGYYYGSNTGNPGKDFESTIMETSDPYSQFFEF